MAQTDGPGTGVEHLGVEHLPFFITAPGQPDILFNITIGFMLVLLLLLGNFYLQLHSVPDRMAHRANHAQLQLIGILTLIALLTHNNIFWVAALVIAAINLPDLMTPVNSIARSLRKLAREGADPDPDPDPDPDADPDADPGAGPHAPRPEARDV